MIIRFPATGTEWQVDIYDQNIPKNIDKIIITFVENFEANYSRFKDTSFVTKLSQNPGEYPIPQTAKKLLDFYTKLSDLTGNLFTPTIGDTLVSAGYDKHYSLKPQTNITNASPWQNIFYNEKIISSRQNVQLDFGAAGKGYCIDLVCMLLQSHSLDNFCVDAGGDIRVVGKKQLTIGLEHPEDKTSVIGTIEVVNTSLCGSSGSRRKWANFHHIFDPKTNSSPANILATWVTANTCMEADGLATALFLVSPEKLKGDFKFEYLILNSDYTIDKSSEFKAELFTPLF